MTTNASSPLSLEQNPSSSSSSSSSALSLSPSAASSPSFCSSFLNDELRPTDHAAIARHNPPPSAPRTLDLREPSSSAMPWVDTEKSYVMASKFLVIVVMVISAIALGSMAFVISSREERDDFERQVGKPSKRFENLESYWV
jgi:hypothetical protein